MLDKTVMSLPPFFGLVRFVALVAAILGCLGGALAVFAGLNAFHFGAAAGVTATMGGVFMILGSLAGLGLVYILLAQAKATIDTRNGILEMLQARDFADQRLTFQRLAGK